MAAPPPVSLRGHDKVDSSIKARQTALGAVLDCLYIFFHIISHIFHMVYMLIKLLGQGHQRPGEECFNTCSPSLHMKEWTAAV